MRKILKPGLDERPAGDAARPVLWVRASAPVGYQHAVAVMEERAALIAAGDASELVWLVEHPPLYTAGTSAKDADLVSPDRFPVYRTGRGGQFTYHGPGQRVVYAMLDLNTRGRDVRRFVASLEAWVIETLDAFGIRGEVRPDRVGVWVARPERGADAEDKIAAIGIRLKRWVSLHGLAINVAPDLEHFSGIVPCGITQYGVTSFRDLGLSAGLEEVDAALAKTFVERFGPIEPCSETDAGTLDGVPD